MYDGIELSGADAFNLEIGGVTIPSLDPNGVYLWSAANSHQGGATCPLLPSEWRLGNGALSIECCDVRWLVTPDGAGANDGPIEPTNIPEWIGGAGPTAHNVGIVYRRYIELEIQVSASSINLKLDSLIQLQPAWKLGSGPYQPRFTMSGNPNSFGAFSDLVTGGYGHRLELTTYNNVSGFVQSPVTFTTQRRPTPTTGINRSNTFPNPATLYPLTMDLSVLDSVSLTLVPS
jgi:hypothetical protein